MTITQSQYGVGDNNGEMLLVTATREVWFETHPTPPHFMEILVILLGSIAILLTVVLIHVLNQSHKLDTLLRAGYIIGTKPRWAVNPGGPAFQYSCLTFTHPKGGRALWLSEAYKQHKLVEKVKYYNIKDIAGE